MPRYTSILLGSVLPLALLLGFFIPPRKLLDPVMFPVQAFYVGLFVYHLCLVLFGLQAAPHVPEGSRRSRFAVLVAAHDEEAVIGHLIASLRASDYPAEHITIFVVADHCADRTAEAARRAGGVVFERDEGARDGKGAALEWLLQRVWATGRPCDAALLVDADNLVAPDFLRKMDAYLQRGDQVIQGYLGTKNPNDSWITRAIYATYAYTNRFFQLAKATLGLSSSLGGTGLCIAMPLLRRLGWRCGALTEDLEFQIRAVLDGVRPSWAWDAVVYDEKPLTFRVAFRQRRRWMQGHASVAVRYTVPLFRRAVKTSDPVAWDAAVYLSTPFWLAAACLLGLVHVANGFAPLFTYLYPPWVPPVFLLLSLTYPYLALRMDGRSTAPYARLSTLAGVLLLGLSWPLLGLLGVLYRRRRVWVKTAHPRALSLDETRGEHIPLTLAGARAPGLGSVRLLAGGLIALAIVATITPHITARRLRPLLEEGGLLLLSGQPDRALGLFTEAIRQQPDDPVAHAFLALAQRMRGNHFAALRALRQVKRLDPDLGDTVVVVVDFLLRHRAHPHAAALRHDLLSSVRSGADAYAWVANLFIDRRRLADAETITQDGLRRLGPELPLLRVQGYLHLHRNRPAEAAAVLRRAHRIAPTDAGILINLGWSYVRLRHYPGAIRVWELALRFDPANGALRRDLDRVRRLAAPQPSATPTVHDRPGGAAATVLSARDVERGGKTGEG